MSLLIGNEMVHNSDRCSTKLKDPTRPVQQILDNMDEVFTKLGIRVIRQDNIPVVDTICRALWVRDPSINIDNKIVMLPGWSSGRKDEWKNHPYAKGTDNSFFVMPEDPENMEGGDVIQDKNRILIGLGMRTNHAGVIWLKKNMKEITTQKKEIITIHHCALHLDCCLTVLTNGELFYSKKYISNLPVILHKLYKVTAIEDIIGRKVDPNLAANAVIYNQNIITTDQVKFKPLRNHWSELGYTVIEIPYGTLWRYKGGIRCLTQWLTNPKCPIT